MGEKVDAVLDMCKKQGYVPKDCKLDGELVWLLVSMGKNPCVGCNMDRSICGVPK
jgi:hypothetical protein